MYTASEHICSIPTLKIYSSRNLTEKEHNSFVSHKTKCYRYIGSNRGACLSFLLDFHIPFHSP